MKLLTERPLSQDALRPLSVGGTAFGMNFRVRAASAADIPAMHHVRNDVRENRLYDPQRVQEASYLPYIAAGSAWVAETDAGIVGFAAIDAQARRVWALFVDPGAEGSGIGRALHRRMLEWAQEQGISTLSLDTEEGTRAAHFYERAGWRRAGFTDDGGVLFEISLRN